MSNEKTEGVIDTNTEGAVSEPFDVHKHLSVALYLYNDSGSHVGHKIVLQASPSDSEADDFVNTGHEVTALEPILLTTILADRVRLKVTTPEGSQSSTKYVMICQ